jgi:cold shock CspA family protein
METKYGTIVTLKKDKGYGFIRPNDVEERKNDIFFHANDVLNPEYQQLKTGDRVEYLTKETKKGKAAYDVVAM